MRPPPRAHSVLLQDIERGNRDPRDHIRGMSRLLPPNLVPIRLDVQVSTFGTAQDQPSPEYPGIVQNNASRCSPGTSEIRQQHEMRGHRHTNEPGVSRHPSSSAATTERQPKRNFQYRTSSSDHEKRKKEILKLLEPIAGGDESDQSYVCVCWGKESRSKIVTIRVPHAANEVVTWRMINKVWYANRGWWRKYIPLLDARKIRCAQVSHPV